MYTERWKSSSSFSRLCESTEQPQHRENGTVYTYRLEKLYIYIYQVSFSDIVPQQQVEMFELFGASVVALCTPCGIHLWASAALRNTAFDRQVFRLLACWLMLANYVEGIRESVIAFTVFRWLLWKVDLGTF